MTAPESTEIRSVQAERTEPYSPGEVAAWLADLPDEFLACRLFLHAWIPPTGYHDRTVNGRAVKAMTLVCDRCNSEKEPRIKIMRRGRRGESVVRDGNPGMIYVEGYLAPPGMRITKDDVWAEWARRSGLLRR